MNTGTDRTAAAERLVAAKAGDGVALGTVLDHFRPYLRVHAELGIHRLVRGKADPCDLVQETHLAAVEEFARFRGETEGELAAWLLAILKDRLSKLVRRHVGTRMRDARLDRELADSSRRVDEQLAATGSTPSQRAGRREDAVAVAAALERLSADHRTVLVLRHIEGLTFPEVGVRMARTDEAARKLWTRAVKEFRRVTGGTFE